MRVKRVKQKIKASLKRRTQKTLDQTLLALQHPLVERVRLRIKDAYESRNNLGRTGLPAFVVQSIFSRVDNILEQFHHSSGASARTVAEEKAPMPRTLNRTVKKTVKKTRKQ